MRKYIIVTGVFCVLLCARTLFVPAESAVPVAGRNCELAPFLGRDLVPVRSARLLNALVGLYPEKAGQMKDLCLRLPADKHLRLERALAGVGLPVDIAAERSRLCSRSAHWENLFALIARFDIDIAAQRDIVRSARLVDALFNDDEDFPGVIGHTVHVAYLLLSFFETTEQFRDIIYLSDRASGQFYNEVSRLFDMMIPFHRQNMPLWFLRQIPDIYMFHIEFERREALPQVLCAALLHDIGKFFIPPEVLNFPGRHSLEQSRVMRLHPVFSYMLCNAADVDPEISHLVLHHHERPSGDGYPDMLYDTALDWRMCLLSAVDVFSALDEARPYKRGLPPARCLSIMREMSAVGELDNETVNAFESSLAQHNPLLRTCA